MAGRLRPEGLPDSSLLLGLLCSLQRKDHEATSPMGPGKGCWARPWWACMLPSPWLLRPVGPWASSLLPRHPRGHSHPCPPVPRSHRAFPKAPATPLSPCAPDISSPARLTSSAVSVLGLCLWFPAVTPEPRTLPDPWYVPSPSWLVP